MKQVAFILSVVAIGVTLTAIGNRSSDSMADSKLTGSWQIVKAQYGSGPMKTLGEGDLTTIKLFTATRWSVAFYNEKTKVFDGAGGGTYKLNGDQYLETIEYFSWHSDAVGQTTKFTLTLENGMLHQFGKMEYKGDKNYVIDEWYKKIE